MFLKSASTEKQASHGGARTAVAHRRAPAWSSLSIKGVQVIPVVTSMNFCSPLMTDIFSYRRTYRPRSRSGHGTKVWQVARRCRRLRPGLGWFSRMELF